MIKASTSKNPAATALQETMSATTGMASAYTNPATIILQATMPAPTTTQA
jgi:hypothetical protein